jgi:hypothetical protein
MVVGAAMKTDCAGIRAGHRFKTVGIETASWMPFSATVGAMLRRDKAR